MTLSKVQITGILMAVVLSLGFAVYQAQGESFTGTATNVKTATSTTVGPDTVVTLFSRNSECNSRIVSTKDTGIRVSFQDVTGFSSTTLSSSIGFFQGASTTVSYDSGEYGCGLMTAIGLSASSTITIAETQ